MRLVMRDTRAPDTTTEYARECQRVVSAGLFPVATVLGASSGVVRSAVILGARGLDLLLA